MPLRGPSNSSPCTHSAEEKVDIRRAAAGLQGCLLHQPGWASNVTGPGPNADSFAHHCNPAKRPQAGRGAEPSFQQHKYCPAEGLGRFSIQRRNGVSLLADVLIFPGPTVGSGTAFREERGQPSVEPRKLRNKRERGARRLRPRRAGPRVSSDLRKLTSHGQASLGYSSHRSGLVWHVKLSQHEKWP